MSKPQRKLNKWQLNKWQFVYTSGKDYMRSESGWHLVTCGVFKLTSLPDEGVRVGKSNYKGFMLNWHYWFPIESGY